MKNPTMSAEAIGILAAYLPRDLTPEQTERIIKASEYAHEQSFEEGRRYQLVIENLYREAASGGAV